MSSKTKCSGTFGTGTFGGIFCIVIFILFLCCHTINSDEKKSLFATRTRSFYEDNATDYVKETDNDFWKISSPEEQQIDSKQLEKAQKELESIPATMSFLVIRNGFLVKESYLHGSAVNHSNNIHSASKGVIAALIGILVHNGLLNRDDQLGALFPEYEMGNDNQSKITVRQLLTMSAGFECTEDESEYLLQDEKNWVQAILKLNLKNAPGKVFNYSTAQSHLLSAIITKVTGLSSEEFAQRTLFKPLGITISRWGSDPQGISSGGYNLYMTARSLAKFALLHLNQGMLNNHFILPPEWVNETLTAQINTYDRDGKYQYRYGYLWWLTKIQDYEIKKLWGHGGQFAYLIPSFNTVVVVTNNTNQQFDEKKYDEMDGEQFIDEFIIPALR